nr:MAG TPA: hypothetical protein [Caudoviricetes sp.]
MPENLPHYAATPVLKVWRCSCTSLQNTSP